MKRLADIEPRRIDLAHLPTRIECLKKDYHGVEVHIKRDDQTGFEMSGNKVRKLEYTLKAALDAGCDTVITCGGIQTNHGRATVIAAVKLGLTPHLVLRSEGTPQMAGNYFLDEFFGAQIHLISPDAYRNERGEIMAALRDELAQQGHKAFVIPEGASDGLGNWGYIRAVSEIVEQERDSGYSFDVIAAAMGSGSTHAGLVLGTHLLGTSHQVLGFNIYDAQVDATAKVRQLALESGLDVTLDDQRFEILNDYVGLGYALSTEEELEWIRSFARNEGVMLDTVYTGKALRGLFKEIERGRFPEGTRILFIHTGGGFGNFSKMDLLLQNR